MVVTVDGAPDASGKCLRVPWYPPDGPPDSPGRSGTIREVADYL